MVSLAASADVAAMQLKRAAVARVFMDFPHCLSSATCASSESETSLGGLGSPPGTIPFGKSERCLLETLADPRTSAIVASPLVTSTDEFVARQIAKRLGDHVLLHASKAGELPCFSLRLLDVAEEVIVPAHDAPSIDVRLNTSLSRTVRRFLGMPEQSQQDDDRDRNADQPKQSAFSESHVTSPPLSRVDRQARQKFLMFQCTKLHAGTCRNQAR